MAHFERDIGASATGPLSLSQLLELLGAADGAKRSRKDAVACFLAGGDGWEQALQQLRGAFAEEARLMDDQSE